MWEMRDDHFDRQYAEHAQSLLGFIAYRTGNRSVAEDLLADTFERALRSRRRFDPRKGAEKTWLYTIALNLTRDHARRAGAEQRALERVGAAPAAESGAELAAVEQRDAVMRALDVLSDDEREVVALRYGADLPMREIARATGERVTTVEARVYRSLRKLRATLEEG